MSFIICQHCGDRYPDFDVAHVCSSGPRAPVLASETLDVVADVGLAVMDFMVDILSAVSDD
jgi:hypothetical protein